MKASFDLWLYIIERDDSGTTAELLGHPELRVFGEAAELLAGAVEEGVARRINEWPARDLRRFGFIAEAELRRVSIELPLPRRLETDTPRILEVPIIVRHSEVRPRWRVVVPSLDLNLFFVKGKQVETEVPKEILKALRRRDAITDLRRLALAYGADREDELLKVTLTEEVPGLRDQLRKRSAKDPTKTPELDAVSEDIARLMRRRFPRVGCYEREGPIQRLRAALLGGRRGAVVLVGGRGVGKTAVAFELGQRLAAERESSAADLPEDDEAERKATLRRGRMVTTTGAQVVAGMSAMGDLEARCRRIIEECRRDRIVIHGGRLLELMQAGRHSCSTLGVAAHLKEAVANGEVRLVVEAEADDLIRAEELDPGFVGLLERIDIDAPTHGEATRILRSVAEDACVGREVRVTADGIGALLSLYSRFDPYASLPGRCVRMLLDRCERAAAGGRPTQAEVAAGEAAGPVVLDADAMTRAFATETGLPLWLLRDDERLDPAQVASQLRERVMGQGDAVDEVAELVCRVKAGLAGGEKPLMSLLFVGPTGVGKTELSKALAELFFSDESQLVRFDMSEYANPVAVARLTGALGTGTERGEGQLTRKLREAPFGVVLFDELEKADASFFDLLLQILGEGRLTDAAGRVASFRHAVVIMTSNLGARASGRGELGFSGGGEGEDPYQAAVEAHFRPELLNRIDAVIPFASLGPAVIRAVTDRQLGQLERRDGVLRRQLRLEVSSESKDWLAERGFDPAMGARPLKRAVERHLALPLAEALSRKGQVLARPVEVALRSGALRVEIGPPDAELDLATRPMAALADDISDQRRQLWKVRDGQRVIRLLNTRTMLLRELERAEKRKKRGRGSSDWSGEKAAQLQRIEAWLATQDRIIGEVEELESLVVGALLSGVGAGDADFLGPMVQEQRLCVRELFLDLLGFSTKRPDRAFLILSADFSFLRLVAPAYLELCEAFELDVELRLRHSWDVVTPTEEGASESLRLSRVEVIASLEELRAPPEKGAVCLGMSLRGKHAATLLRGEGGRHEWSDGPRSNGVLGVGLHERRPKDADDATWFTGTGPLRRKYDLKAGRIRDEATEASRAFTRMSLGRVLRGMAEEALDRALAEDLA